MLGDSQKNVYFDLAVQTAQNNSLPGDSFFRQTAYKEIIIPTFTGNDT